MTIHFNPDIKADRAVAIQRFIEQEVDRDNDFYYAATTQNPSDYIYLRADWHKSPGDPQEHLTGDLYIVSNPELSDTSQETYVSDREIRIRTSAMSTRPATSQCFLRVRSMMGTMKF